MKAAHSQTPASVSSSRSGRTQPRLRDTIYYQLSVAFALVVSLTCFAIVTFLFPAWRDLYDRIHQQIYWELAENVADLVEPSILETGDLNKLYRVFYELSVLNPGIEIYLLNEQGNVVAHGRTIDWGYFAFDQVAMEPIIRAVDSKEPIPKLFSRSPIDVKTGPFSAARVFFKGEPHYLFVPLRSKQAYLIIRSSGERWMVEVVLWGFLLIVLTGVIMAFLLIRYLTRSIRQLAFAAEHFAEGDFAYRVDMQSTDEVGMLAQSMNFMAEKLVESERQRKELIANITHDLRTPLTSMRGFIDTLLTEELPEEKQRRYLGIVASDIQTQSVLISDLFDLSRYDSPSFAPDIEPCKLNELFDDFALRTTQLAAEKSIAVETHIPAELPLVYADAELVERVLQNLAQNAIRYSEANATITLSLHLCEGGVEVAVADSGCGIPEEDLPFIFETFYRVDKARSRNRGGTGLGLAIVKKILDLHGSNISVESRVGEGTKFSFILPFAPSDSETQDQARH